MKQYTYLGFTFRPSSKKQVRIDKQGKKSKVFYTKVLHKSNEKTIDVYL